MQYIRKLMTVLNNTTKDYPVGNSAMNRSMSRFYNFLVSTKTGEVFILSLEEKHNQLWRPLTVTEQRHPSEDSNPLSFSLYTEKSIECIQIPCSYQRSYRSGLFTKCFYIIQIECQFLGSLLCYTYKLSQERIKAMWFKDSFNVKNQ